MLVNYDSRVIIWGIFPVTYNSGVVNYDRRGFIRLATGDQPYSDTSPIGKLFSVANLINILRS